jgi:hypothetical protein
MDTARSLANYTQEYYPYKQIADQDWMETAAKNAVSKQALASDNLYSTGKKFAEDTISGKYLDPTSNPYLQSTYQAAWKQASPAYKSAASKYGAYGSTDAANTMGSAAADLASDMYGKNYANERSNQMSALSALPSINNMGYMDANQLKTYGEAARDYTQSLYEAEKDKWDYNQNEGWNRINKYSNIINTLSGGGGGTQTTQTPYYSSTLGNIGGMLGGAGSLAKGLTSLFALL